MTPEKYLGSSVLPLIKAKVDAKQDALVGSGAGQNIKTVNGESILGSGDIELPTAKLYDAYGTNTDGALTQKFASEKLQALETSNTSLSGDVESLLEYAEATVQLDTTLSAENTNSTVTIVKKQAALNNIEAATETNLPLPVASETQAGVINPSTYQTIQDTAEKVENIMGGSVAIADLPASPTTEQLTDAWKAATGKDEIVNGAKIFDSTNNKTWTYYENAAAWSAIDNNNPTIELNNFTNEAAGLILGDNTTDGKVQAESDGTGSVKGWDTVKTDIANNTTNITALQTTVGNLDDVYAKISALETVENTVTALQTTVAGKQDTLVGSGTGQNIKTINGESLLGTGDIEIDVPAAMTTAEFNALWGA